VAILGLDIGGANLKAATAGKRAASVPFALWKHHEKLPEILAELVARFPDADELAVTMTGELCDCFATKRDGVNAILDAVESLSHGRLIRVWTTDGVFVTPDRARLDHLKVAAANWHALATFAGRFSPSGDALLIDIGSTTTDIIPLLAGYPHTLGRTDRDRLRHSELVYIGVRRTPVYAMAVEPVCAELFATTQDVFVVLGLLPENPADNDTADGRALTVEYSLARLARMLGGDRDTLQNLTLIEFAIRLHARILEVIASAVGNAWHSPRGDIEWERVILSGAGEFVARRVIEKVLPERLRANVFSLNDELGPDVSACAPAYAVAVLATEQRG